MKKAHQSFHQIGQLPCNDGELLESDTNVFGIVASYVGRFAHAVERSGKVQSAGRMTATRFGHVLDRRFELDQAIPVRGQNLK